MIIKLRYSDLKIIFLLFLKGAAGREKTCKEPACFEYIHVIIVNLNIKLF
jgi:hypothetical protein